MRTSLNRIHQIELFLEGKMATSDALVFQARMLLDPMLRHEVKLQKRSALVINLYGRKKLRAEIEKIHHDIFKDESGHSLKHRIRMLFINP